MAMKRWIALLLLAAAVASGSVQAPVPRNTNSDLDLARILYIIRPGKL